MRDLTLTDVQRLDGCTAEAEVVFHMDEDTFRAFYERTARSVWMYLSRMTGDRQAADDLLQETYYRFLRIERAFESESHRRNYLFRIATNLVRDGQRPEATASRTSCSRGHSISVTGFLVSRSA